MISKNQIKQIQALHQKKFRDQQGRFLVEGVKTVRELIASGSYGISELFATADFVREELQALKKSGIKYSEITEGELEQLSTLSTPNKVLAVCNYAHNVGSPSFDFKKQFSLFLDDIRDPGNLGTILRISDWFGISTIFCSPTTCDIYNPKVIQATMGAFLRVKLVYTPLDKLISENNVSQLYGAVLNGTNIYSEQLHPGLIIIGNEANGISKENLSRITHPLTIPAHQQGGSESLNAAIATGIIVAEFFRQLNFK
jgi:TrmH family RNA methyltransferase